MSSERKRQSLISFGDVNMFTLSGVVMSNDSRKMTLRSGAIEREILIQNPLGKDFTGCRAVVWGHLGNRDLCAEHYHVFTPEGERIHAS